MSTLCGCGAVSSVVETSKRVTAKLTGADDPNNTGLLAQAGRMQNAGTDAVANAAGVKTDTSSKDGKSSPKVGADANVAVVDPQTSTVQASAQPEPMTTRDMQMILSRLGYEPGAVDGVSGKRTVDALKKFQQAKKIPVTGTLNPETIAQLRGASPTK